MSWQPAEVRGTLAFVLPVIIQPGFTAGLWIALVVGNGISAAAITGAVGAFFASQLPPRVRFTGTATGREVGNVLGSGGVPLLAAQLAYVGGGGSIVLLSGLFLGVAILGLVGVALARPLDAVGTDRVVATDRPQAATAV